MTDDPPEIKLSVDNPGEADHPLVTGEVVVDGWAWAPEGVSVQVTVAGEPVAVRQGIWRPDVSMALGLPGDTGFKAVGSVVGVPAGPAEIVVTATAAGGATLDARRSVRITDAARASAPRPRPFTGFSERFDPRSSPGTFTHAEHVSRYRWAAQLAEGRDVLDAACGVGFGAHILRAGGARTVTGVDASAAAIVEARDQAADGLTFTLGDLRELPFDDDSFDLAVCFEAIEHVAEQGRVLDELKRVLRPDGVLAISTPVPEAVGIHNAHHVAEISPDEHEQLLRERFAGVASYWQHSAITSVVSRRPPFGMPAEPVAPVRWTAGPVEAVYSLALAGDGPLPEAPALGAMAAGQDLAAIITESFRLKDELATAQAELRAETARADRAEHAYRAVAREREAG